MSVSSLVRLLTAAVVGGQLLGACMLERAGSQGGPSVEAEDPESDSSEGIPGANPLTPGSETGAVGTPMIDSGLQTDPVALDAESPIGEPVVAAPSDASLSVPPAAGESPAVVPPPAAAPTPPLASPAQDTPPSDRGAKPEPAPSSPAAPAPQPMQPRPTAPQMPPQMPPTVPAPPPSQLGLRLSSTAFDASGTLPSLYACDGVPPPLHWESAPAGTAAYALSFTEIDGTGRRTLWAIHGIPGALEGLMQDFHGGLLRIASSRCISGARYEYTLYALSRTPSGVSQSVTRTEIIGGKVVSNYRPPEGVLESTSLSAYFTGR